MDEIREKLVELLEDDDCPLLYVLGENVGSLADYLISNGVTVRPPKPWQNCSNCGDYTTRIGCGLCVSSIDESGTRNSVPSHWMPLPEPPGKDVGAK